MALPSTSEQLLPPQPPARSWLARLVASYREWLPGAIVAAVLCWAYFPVFAAMEESWEQDSRYSHGFLVPLFAAYLLWHRRRMIAAKPWFLPSWWGVPFVLVGLAIHAVGSYLYFDWLNAMSLLICLGGLALLLGSWRTLRWAWPAMAFLMFMIPLPYRLETALSLPLQSIGARISTYALQTLGFAAFAEGNKIRMGDVQLNVVEACSGLSMMMVFFALSTAVAIVIRRPLWERLLLVASAVPIAVFANVTRIVIKGVLQKLAGAYWAEQFHENWAPFWMMLLALGMMWVELRLLSWVIQTRQVPDSVTFAKNMVLAGPTKPRSTPARLRKARHK